MATGEAVCRGFDPVGDAVLLARPGDSNTLIGGERTTGLPPLGGRELGWGGGLITPWPGPGE